jgi:hypothetical protein
MAATIRASKQGREIVDQARKKKGWTIKAAAWYQNANTSEATLKRFRRGLAIQQDAFIGICRAVGIENWQEIVDDSPQAQTDFRPEFSQYDAAWVGREQLVAELSDKLQRSCRLLILLGITGIGKTALAERLVVELQDWFSGDWKNKFKRANFDYEDKANDFASVAARWLEEWGERLSPAEKKPELLLYRLVKHLRENQVLVLIDSLERLLTGNEEDGWGDFADEWWKKFFLSLLSAESCQSRLIVTSQDLPVKLVDSRYQNFWRRQVLYGLDESEQVTLFETTGLDVNENSPDKSLLLKIGKAYEGHPLVLRVIVGEIMESFRANVRAYWKKYGDEIEEVKEALDLARNEGIVEGKTDRWALDRYTHELKKQVKVRLDKTFARLETDVKDAYFLLCTASVYRGEVPESFWVSHLEYRGYDKQRCEDALQTLRDRYLVEDRGIDHEDERLVGQHNLIRSVALTRRSNLFPEN